MLQPLLPTGESGNNHYTFATYQILSWYPRIVVFPNFIDKARAQHIIELASPRLVKSDVKLRHGESASKAASQRSSAGVFMRREDDAGGVLGWLQDKIEAVTLTPASHGEAFYVMRYRQGEAYQPHMDVYDPAEYGPQKSSRLATLILYLGEPEGGGETAFPREGKEGDKRKLPDAAGCSKLGFKYTPRAGDALLFYSLHPDNSIDPRALHSGCPVARGTKWVVTKWLHNRPLQVNMGGFGWR
ncbi:hypothetical protein OEZ86_008188 [Tetradesmus obliquus]|nr:hypothetical protein OEZ86_008188 [Tetradesmus obliquus]